MSGVDIDFYFWLDFYFLLHFLTGRPQVVKVGNALSSTLILYICAPHGCVLSPPLHSLHTHDYTAKYNSNCTIKFADDITVIGLITDNDEGVYRWEVQDLAVMMPKQ